MKQLNNKTIALNNLVRQNIQQLKPYSSARSEFKGSADIFLDANENPFETGLNRYPDPLQWAVKEKISQIKGVPVENIFLGNGSDEVIDLLIRIFCEPRIDHIITLPPTYGMYKVSAGIADVANIEIPLTAAFQPNVEAILAKATAHSKLLFLCTPNNPTGNAFELERLQKLAVGFPGIVVVDEAYIDFAQGPSALSLLDQYPNVVVMQTFSKAWGLAGIRLGMAFASEKIIELFNRVKPPYNVNQLTQKAALDALENNKNQTAWVDQILKQRKALTLDIQKLDFVERIYPSDANFLLVKVLSPNKLYDYLIREKIIVRNRSTVLMCDGCLRITVGTEAENQQLLKKLQDYSKSK